MGSEIFTGDYLPTPKTIYYETTLDLSIAIFTGNLNKL